MFKRIRTVFSKFIDKASAILLSRDRLVELIEDFKLELISNDVAYDVAEEICNRIREAVDEKIVKDRESLIHLLRNIIRYYFEAVERFDLLKEARENKLYKIVFLGVNGVGKTTTIAKLALIFKENGFKPLMVAADTFRAGAQEQLRIHGEKIGVPVFSGKYGADPAAVVYDSISYASNRGFNVLLVDTAGRMHVDVDLVEELKKIVRVAKPHRNLLVVDALTGNDAVEQARFFDGAVGVDGVIVTKVDAYEQGGVPLSVVYAIRKPIIMIGTGQGYKDIKYFSIDDFLDKIISLK
ncbi:MAG: signal recognition particle-docking protein FtsY [Thermoprotei archaeon]|nr:MAG: signal recognition particle-docking protein FtsY [Thermoprotei archaeon]